QAVLPKHAPLRVEPLSARPACGCAECSRSSALRVRLGDETALHASGLYGAGEHPYAQTFSMFEVAEELLQRSGMEFRDVVRT
ncbi:MAG: hypothetical protein GWN99_14590, partial [Gemmatimonadetes bacterium]|nr:hypothetical protein [Gemmatimonadota bacterium]